MSNHARRAWGRPALATLVTLATVAAGGIAGAGPALANDADGTPILDSQYSGIKLEVTLVDGATSEMPQPIQSLKSAAGCPEGYQKNLSVAIIAPTGTNIETNTASHAHAADIVSFGVPGGTPNKREDLFGLTGDPTNISYSQQYFHATRGLSRITRTTEAATLYENTGGTFWFAIICDSKAPNSSYLGHTGVGVNVSGVTWGTKVILSDPFTVTSDGTITADGAPAPVAQTPQVKVTTASASDDATPKVDATVYKEDGATVAEDATGTVQFYQDGAKIGAPVAVASGKASYTVASALAGTVDGKAYKFTAEYIPGTDDAYEALSQDKSTPLTVTVKATPETATSDLTVTIPKAAGLTLSVAEGGVDLEGKVDGADFAGQAALKQITVTDSRAADSKTEWTLSGQSSELTSGGNTIAPKYLGWDTPTVTGTGATPGAAVAAGGATGLSSAQPLATGNNETSKTTVDANVTLKVPSADVAEGSYKGTLTYTLIG